MKKFIKNTANSIRTKAIRLAATRRSGEGYIDTAVKVPTAVGRGARLRGGLSAPPARTPPPGGWVPCCRRASTLCSAMWSCPR